ncbi:hypothetical protein UY3_07685 [Chelonia mydas]|uniref:Uncharacterized protein n=1 Tax=Chelonia mydas TaxID=8469 RepID=M7BSS5_CHEMY|nr:hypothetical protein UY3_07685 [Chelonia mydas]
MVLGPPAEHRRDPGPRQNWPDLTCDCYRRELLGLPLADYPEDPMVLGPPAEHRRDPVYYPDGAFVATGRRLPITDPENGEVSA